MAKLLADMNDDEYKAAMAAHRAEMDADESTYGFTDDPAARERIAAAERAERAAADARAAIAQSGPLPLTIGADVGLKYVPAEKRAQYTRQMDGTFKLSWISADDRDSFTAHERDIAAGKSATFAPGESPATVAAERKAQEDREAMVWRLVKESEDKKRQDEYNRRVAALRAEEVALKQRYGIK